MNNETVKKNIRKARRENGMTQLALAEKLGLSKTSYNNLESGETKLISDKLEKIAELLSTTPEKLVLGYQPVEASAMKLKDILAEADEREKALKKSHEEEIAQLRRQIMSLEHLAAALQDTISTQKDIIDLLRKNGGETAGTEA